jgi:hypothetical protein
VLKFFLDKGANPHLEIRMPESRPTALLSYIAQLLNSRDNKKYTIFAENTQEDWKLLKLLLDYGADPSKLHQYDFYYTLGWLVNIPIDVELLLRYGANPNSIDKLGGRTPLMVLLEKFNNEPDKRRIDDFLESAKILIQKGASLNVPNKKGETPNKLISEFAVSKNTNKREFGSQLQEFLAEYKDSVHQKQKEIRENSLAILEQPGGLRQRARLATNSNFKTDVATKASLCKILNDEMYRSELYNLAREMGLPVTEKTKKKELCEMIAAYGLSVI